MTRTNTTFRQPAAFARKLRYTAFHVVRIDSFGPLKRAIDISFAAPALALCFPFFLLFALYRKLRGWPILAGTERVGKLGARYTQYAFSGLERHSALRKAPQLINILAGEMSLIGPRPAAPGDPVVRANGYARLSVKPGIISPWWLRQRANIDFDDEAAADREYLNKASLSSDIGIVLRAIPALAFSERREEAPRTVEILGVRIDNISMAEALGWIRQRLDGDEQTTVFMTNAHCANVSCRYPEYHDALLASGLNLADGVGVRLAGKIKGTPIRQNVNGTDMFPRLCTMLQNSGRSVYLLGGRPGVAARVAEWIGKRYPGTSIAGHRDGYFKAAEESQVAEVIRASGASLLLVAMGVPQQELWIQRNLPRTGVSVAMGVGGLFDFYSGRIPRAPSWMREAGVEWIWRLLQEPGRMWKRYLIGNWTFLLRFIFHELKMYRPRPGSTGG
jgi:N-acetylglucosaminyldiphosphoundecaprenol N-acetyl-beta-D-mannosaminyltransferase